MELKYIWRFFEASGWLAAGVLLIWVLPIVYLVRNVIIRFKENVLSPKEFAVETTKDFILAMVASFCFGLLLIWLSKLVYREGKNKTLGMGVSKTID